MDNIRRYIHGTAKSAGKIMCIRDGVTSEGAVLVVL